MKKKIIGLCAILLAVSGCGKIPTLDNGEEAIVTFDDDHMISVNEFYDLLKESYGLDTLITLADTYILETEFADYKETARETADSTVDSYIESIGGEDEFLNYLRQSGYQSIDAYRDLMYLSVLQNHAIEEYAKLQITDEDIEEYYNNTAVGDMEISHILITPDVDDDATDEETEEAEAAAEATIEEIISKLNEAKENGEDIEKTFAALVEEYSEDESTIDDDGNIGRINYGSFDDRYDELIAAATELEVGEYSTEVITTELGYHVILKTAEYDKESLEDLKDEIRTTLSEDYITDNSTSIGFNALQHYRNEYGMDIVDDEVAKQYSNYVQSALAAIQNAETNQEENN